MAKRNRFEVLARPELDALFRTARRIVGNRAIAEEIVQESCLRAFASFCAADEPAAFRPWLFRITVNQALDHLRGARRAAPWCTEASDAAYVAPDLSLDGQPHTVAEGREIGRAVERAMMALAPEARAVAVLVLIEEMSYAEAAEALAISEDLVRSRLSRARAELRRDLAEHATDLAPRSTNPLYTSIKRGPQ